MMTKNKAQDTVVFGHGQTFTKCFFKKTMLSGEAPNSLRSHIPPQHRPASSARNATGAACGAVLRLVIRGIPLSSSPGSALSYNQRARLRRREGKSAERDRNERCEARGDILFTFSAASVKSRREGPGPHKPRRSQPRRGGVPTVRPRRRTSGTFALDSHR